MAKPDLNNGTKITFLNLNVHIIINIQFNVFNIPQLNYST